MMKKFLLGIFLVFNVFVGISQENSEQVSNKSQSKSIQSVFVINNLKSIDSEKPIDTTGIDYRINKMFTPFTNWLEGIVFYSIPLHKNDELPKVVTTTKQSSADEKLINYHIIFVKNDTISLSKGNVVKGENFQITLDKYSKYSAYTWVFKDKEKGIILFKAKGNEIIVNFHPNLLPNNIEIELLKSDAGLPLILVWLVVASVFFTIALKFINVRGFKYFPKIIKGLYTKPEDTGEVTHFQALSAALSGTVGLGNISGVAVAIATGGPGATFWMIAAGLLGMSAKFVECTLGVKYRNVQADGTISGGPMYYLTKGLAEKNLATFGKVLAVIFAVACVGGSFGGGNMYQVNQAYKQFVNLSWFQDSFFTNNAWFFGLLMAIIVGLVILGGIKSIAKVTDKIVPFMCGMYVLAALVIIFDNVATLPTAIEVIISGAFSPQAIAGGIIGVMIQGFKRAAFSNEAGIGSASIAHSAVKTGEPVTEGFVALLEPFIDTVIVCTMTALVLVITGVYNDTNSVGIELTSKAFTSHFTWFKPILALAVILFAFSTMISWSYYGLKAWTYLFGESKKTESIYKLLFCVFVIVGASMELGKVIDFSDSMIFIMSVPNIIGLYILSGDVRRDLASFIRRVKSGELKENHETTN